MKLIEIQVDRLVGPTHHFGGLGVGNVASLSHAGNVSNPASAAIQGLDKMRLVASFGVPQFILPPQPRPDVAFLKQVGFQIADGESLNQVAQQTPSVLSAAMSCSAMWTANAATVSPAIDNRFNVPSMTVANLDASLHRAIEAKATRQELQGLFPQANVLPPLPGGAAMRDEGAANHMRFGSDQNQAGIHLFVYGDGEPEPNHFWPRQSRLACQTLAIGQGLDPENTFFVKQHPDAIDAGAFHNDVVAASHHDLLIHHERAFCDPDSVIKQMADRYEQLFRRPLRRIVVSETDLPLADAVRTYLFNSQLISPQVDTENAAAPVLICPLQVQQHDQARTVVESWIGESKPFSDVRYVDLIQSMAGGGGPACLRLRIPLTPAELAQCNPRHRWTEELDDRLRQTIREFYPSEVSPMDLASAELISQSQQAHAEIAKLFQ
ncbi:Succinylarginine dihydrolase [Rhodopirellula maiorica SM1]|uniref:Succinylarginine dihydrolase n=1 Tax=Rhodopirellula maiorica SM1 TaxID=1265738 RepID=M5S782_9BACT|nr:N-succinylarginine dihydrolase [Rhodopirellula maiorica]EMI22049.1 Succinylarginine dihydrolase [Rhodopirellula maiorica SM1]